MNRTEIARRGLAVCLLIGLCLFLAQAAWAEELFTQKDTAVFDGTNATVITLEGDSARVEGLGATVDGSVVTIASAGSYQLTGTLNGQLRVNLTQKGSVALLLGGVSVSCDGDAALVIEGSSKTVVTLAAGTTNAFTDSGALSDDEDAATAAIFSRDDLTFNGEGALIVNAQRNDGIACKDTLKFVSGSYEVSAVDDALVAKDALVIGGGSYTLTAGGDGIKATNAEDAALGHVTIVDGELAITSGADGIQAETSVLISSGRFAIQSGGGSVEPDTSAYSPRDRGWNDWVATEDEQTGSSAKGVKAGTLLSLAGADMRVDALDDALHANGDVSIQGGSYVLLSGDDGAHADGALTVGDGTLSVERSYEGLEGETITISGGNIRVAASDDGLNAAGGDDAQSDWMGGRFGGAEGGTGSIVISGGSVRVSAYGDGVDSNGSVAMTGGLLAISGPANSGNGALDYTSVFTLSGGTLVALDMGGMAMTPSETTVAGFATACSGAGGQALSVRDESGAELIAFTPDKDYAYAVVFSDRLADGGAYTLVSGNESASVSASLSVTGGFGGFGRGGFGGGGRPDTMPEGMPDDLPAEPPEGMPDNMPGGRPGGGRR